MRPLPPSMQAKLDAGVTTFCRCWRIDPIAGAALGFTDHDADIVLDGLRFDAASGFSGSSIERTLGLAIDNVTVSGALQSERIREADVAAGIFDGATVRLWLVDWRDPAQRYLQFKGEIGEITTGANGFEAEIRGLSERLNRPVGRRFLQVCDAEVGDARCGFDIETPGFKGAGLVVAAISSRLFDVSGVSSFAEGWFDDGVLTWRSGEMEGRRQRVRTHARRSELARIELVETPLRDASPGDLVEIIAGCDKRSATCRNKFDNLVNFRGFPHVPGDSWIAAHPTETTINDGGRRGS